MYSSEAKNKISLLLCNTYNEPLFVANIKLLKSLKTEAIATVPSILLNAFFKDF